MLMWIHYRVLHSRFKAPLMDVIASQGNAEGKTGALHPDGNI